MIDLPNKEKFRVGEIAMYAETTEHTVRRWIREYRHPLIAIKIGGMLWIRRQDFLDFIKRLGTEQLR